jgi:hypothetical protein
MFFDNLTEAQHPDKFRPLSPTNLGEWKILCSSVARGSKAELQAAREHRNSNV